MLAPESLRLSEFSLAIRESTIRRLKAVAEDRENWSPDPDAMSFADIAQHLIDCDKWLFEKLKNPGLKSITGKAGTAQVQSHGEYLQLLEALKRIGAMRAELIKHLNGRDWSNLIFDDRVFGKVEVWWLIVRGNLDHEIHHRGQIATYLRLMRLSD